MKTPRRLFSALCLGLLVVLPLNAAPELVGLLSIPGATRFRLVDREAGTSAWLTLQQTFGAYTLASYDPKTDVLVLTKDGTRIELRLGPAKVGATSEPTRTTVSGSVELNGDKIPLERATLILGEDNALPLRPGVVLHLTPQAKPDGTMAISSSWEMPGPNGATIRQVPATIVVQPGREAAISLAMPGLTFTLRLTPTLE